MNMGDKIRAIMRKTRKTQGQVAEALNVSQPTVHRWLTGAEPEGHRRDAINDMYDAVFGDAEAPGAVLPLMGYVGAGAMIEPDFEQLPPEGMDQVEIPLAMPDGLVCFKVRGNSMLPQFRDGATIVVWAEQKRPLSYFYGQEAIVRTSDGRRFIKTIMRGASGDGTVNLTSWNAPAIENVRLEWIGEIFMTLPPSFSGRF